MFGERSHEPKAAGHPALWLHDGGAGRSPRSITPQGEVAPLPLPNGSRLGDGSLQEDARFSELVGNVGVTVRYFNEHVERARAAGGWDWSVEKVLEVIQGARGSHKVFPLHPRRSPGWRGMLHG